MKIQNTYDELLLAATMGATPSAEDIAAVTPPPGKDAKAFAAEVKKTADEIVALKRAGTAALARRKAKEAADAYLAAFDNSGPKPADAASTKTTEKATPAEIAARPPHRQNDPMATPSELAGRVVGRVGR